MKFKYNLKENKLFLIKPNNYGGTTETLIPPENGFVTNYGGYGFQLDLNNLAHWINFTVFSNKMNVFYKQSNEQQIIYYRKEINRNRLEVIEVEFTEKDRVEKREGKWVYLS